MQGEWAGEPVGPDVWATCRQLIPEGSVFAFLAEHREVLLPAEMFADMYPSPNGRPSMPPQVLAAAVLLQTLYGVSDFDAVQQLRCDLRWKAACGLGLHDSAFDPSLLTYFRRRLARSADPQRIFTVIGAVIAATGVLTSRQRRALDSAVLEDAVATQDTVTQLIAAIRRVIRQVPGAAPIAAAQCTACDYAEAGKPRIAWNDEQARAALVDDLVGDAIRLLASLPEQTLDHKATDAVGLLALVAYQDVEPAEGSDGRDGRWRIARRTAPDRMISTIDPEARHIHKTRAHRQDGFKAHLVVEPETGLFTAVALRPGSGPAHHEATVAADLLADERAPVQVFADAAYDGGDARRRLQAAGHRLVIKPAPLRPAIPGGFTLDDFAIDTVADTVSCPAGHTVVLSPAAGRHHQRKALFGDRCACCPLRERCTTAKAGRIVTIRPDHGLMADARRRAATDATWRADYRRWRAPVERGVAWIVARGNRRLRYIGAIKNDAWLHTRAAALNLRRLISLGLTRMNGAWVIASAGA
ncbi:IS1182 family transposase [Streptosporangium sp. CA-135522]|uniref:IS1182 family transposase n=1 Tax=Streptosporangium sp. CA-135522 TaxID=3240072 RepID=UPI003D8BE3F0